MRRQVISFARSAVAVEYEGKQAEGIIEFLFGALPRDEGETCPASRTFRLAHGHGQDRLALFQEERLVYEGYSRGVVAEILLGLVGNSLAERSHGGMLFHAAALGGRGARLLLPGGIAAGKSTLALWLVSQGFNYFSDGLIFVETGGTSIRAFVRPLRLKKPIPESLRRCFDFQKYGTQILSSRESDLIPPSLLRPGNPAEEVHTKIVVFPRYRVDADFIFEPLSKAHGGLELMKCLINARNLPQRGVDEVSRLARKTDFYNLSYSSFDQAEQALANVIQPI